MCSVEVHHPPSPCPSLTWDAKDKGCSGGTGSPCSLPLYMAVCTTLTHMGQRKEDHEAHPPPVTHVHETLVHSAHLATLRAKSRQMTTHSCRQEARQKQVSNYSNLMCEFYKGQQKPTLVTGGEEGIHCGQPARLTPSF